MGNPNADLSDRAEVGEAMNAEKARQIIAAITVDSFGTPTERVADFHMAKGYLECLQEGPEVKALLSYAVHQPFCDMEFNDQCSCGLDDVLTNFRKAVTPLKRTRRICDASKGWKKVEGKEEVCRQCGARRRRRLT